jgi:hypothetical protein
VNVKDSQVGLQKIITWTKNQGKGGMSEKRHAWIVGCDFES